MAFLRVDKKNSGRYMRIVQSYKVDGKPHHRTLYSLGKVEDYTPDELENIAKKLIELAGRDISNLYGEGFSELARYNYGYALIIQALWNTYNLDQLGRRINNRSKIKFSWVDALRLMIAERMNDPCSKLQSSFNQSEYYGLTTDEVALHHIYRSLDLICKEEQNIKDHLFTQQHSLFSTVLDVVFYDVTTLYFDSQQEQEGALRQKGYSKDGKAHKTQIVLGLLVDKNRNPISYQVYQGNTYEGKTLIDALKQIQSKYIIDNVILVADSAMIDKENRDYMVEQKIDYIIGDSIKKLGGKITARLLDNEHYQLLHQSEKNTITYTEVKYKGRRIICTHSTKRARKDAYEREKLIQKAEDWLKDPSKYKSAKNKGAGRFIKNDNEQGALELDIEKIKEDAKYDGYKAISTTNDAQAKDILQRYADLYEVEHSFRTLKSTLEIRPVFHWTDERIRGHICMSFIAYTFINHLRNLTGLSLSILIKTIDRMQLSKIRDNKTNKILYTRSAVNDEQRLLAEKLCLNLPKDANTQSSINQYFKK